jgi:hypothetical protein
MVHLHTHMSDHVKVLVKASKITTRMDVPAPATSGYGQEYSTPGEGG